MVFDVPKNCDTILSYLTAFNLKSIEYSDTVIFKNNFDTDTIKIVVNK